MKKKFGILLVLFSLIFSLGLLDGTAFARSNSHSTYVHGYYRHNGTYVHRYHRTVANNTVRDNYSYKGNYNPWTHKYGTRTYSHSSYHHSSYHYHKH